VAQVFIQATKKKFFLRQIVEGAIASTSKISDALLSFQIQLNSASFQKGRILISTSGNGQSAGFEMNLAGREITPDNCAAMSEEFFEIYEFQLSQNPALVDDGTPANTRAIFAAMRQDDRLYGCTRRGSDFTLLGFPQVGQLGGPA
jgi:hypothetical protein